MSLKSAVPRAPRHNPDRHRDDARAKRRGDLLAAVGRAVVGDDEARDAVFGEEAVGLGDAERLGLIETRNDDRQLDRIGGDERNHVGGRRLHGAAPWHVIEA